MSNTNTKRLPPYEIKFDVTRIYSRPPKAMKFTGKNTIFHSRAQYFLLSDNNTVYTNNRKLHSFKFFSNTATPNQKFTYSNFISGIFNFLNLRYLPPNTKQKYFSCIRRHLLITASAIKKRLFTPSSNNNQTRTYFRFSIRRRVYYFGIYTPCCHTNFPCSSPPTFVTRHGAKCWSHWKEFCQSSTPSPIIHYPEIPIHPKHVRSLRLGVEYTKRFVHNAAANKYLIYRENFRRFSNNKQQLHRFQRLIRSPQSNNRAFLVFQENSSVSQWCKHLPGTIESLDLTAMADEYFKPMPSTAINLNSSVPPSSSIENPNSSRLTTGRNDRFRDFSLTPFGCRWDLFSSSDVPLDLMSISPPSSPESVPSPEPYTTFDLTKWANDNSDSHDS